MQKCKNADFEGAKFCTLWGSDEVTPTGCKEGFCLNERNSLCSHFEEGIDDDFVDPFDPDA